MLCYSVIRAKTKASDGPRGLGRPRNLENKAPRGLERPRNAWKRSSKRWETRPPAARDKSRQRQFLAPSTKRKFVLRNSFVLGGSFENLLFSLGFLSFLIPDWRSSGVGALDSCVPGNENYSTDVGPNSFCLEFNWT